MEELLNKLYPFLQRVYKNRITMKLSMNEDNLYDLYFDNVDEAVGLLVLSDKGHLKVFAEFCEEEAKETMTKDEIRNITKRFIKELFPESTAVLHLDSIVDLDVFYVIEYVQKDERFKLPMPNSGVIFYIYKNGVIMDMTNEMDTHTILYPAAVLSAEEAKSIFLEGVKPALKIVRHGGEAYPDGDDSFVLVYDFIQTVGIDVKMDGNRTSLEDLGIEKERHFSIPAVEVELVSFESLINLEGMKKIVENGNVEVWSSLPYKYLEERDELTDMDFGTESTVKIMTDSDGLILKRLVTVPVEQGKRHWSAESAYDEALRILFSQYPKAHQYFKRRDDNPAIVDYDYDDEGEELPPYAYQFTFDRFEGDIQVMEENIAIMVSAYTGELVGFEATEYVYEGFSTLIASLPPNDNKALELYLNAFEMKLHWAKEYEEDMLSSRYEIVYLQVFEGSGGHIHYVNANTLEPWVADVTGLEEF